jgi:glutamate-ammonia-ligase adenylyltransferase
VLLALHEHGLLSEQDRSTLEEAYELYQTLTQILRLCVRGHFDAEVPADDLHRLLVSAADEPDMEHLSAKLSELARDVRAIFLKTIDPDHEDAAVF